MLVDDNPNDNFFHERVIRKCAAADAVVVKQSAMDALAYLRSKDGRGDALHPELIFLDINMPGMNGWEFLAEYERLDASCKANVVVVILTTSDNPDDRAKAVATNVAADYKTKPLTPKMLDEIIGKHLFPREDE